MLEIVGRRCKSPKVNATVIFHGSGAIPLFRSDGSFGRLYLFHANTKTEYTEFDVEF